MAKIISGFHPKITDSAISILQSKNIHTVFDLVSEDSDKLMIYSGLSYQEVLELKREITKVYMGGIRKGSELLSSENNAVPTRIKSLDILLNGGLRCGQIYEIYGLSGSGKSQLCHTIAVNIAATFTGVVHYVDTKGDFSGKRSLMIINGRKVTKYTESLVLENIRVTKAETVDELMSFLHSLKSLITVPEKNLLPKLVVIDSLPALFFENTNSPDSRLSQTMSLHHFANALRYIAGELNAIIITTNLVSQWRSLTFGQNQSGNSNDPVFKPFLGKNWLSVPNNRLLIETKDSFETRKITVSKSSYIKCGTSCYVKITNIGIV